jgi:hypothetical protein
MGEGLMFDREIIIFGDPTQLSKCNMLFEKQRKGGLKFKNNFLRKIYVCRQLFYN